MDRLRTLKELVVSTDACLREVFSLTADDLHERMQIRAALVLLLRPHDEISRAEHVLVRELIDLSERLYDALELRQREVGRELRGTPGAETTPGQRPRSIIRVSSV